MLDFIKNAVVHRDIKPQNILIGKDNEFASSLFVIWLTLSYGRYKVADLGISFRGGGTSADGNAQIGTLHYESPEVVSGQEYSFPTDVWSLGVVAYEMCTLRYPFTGKSREELKETILKSEPAPIPSNTSSERNDGGL